MGSFQAQAFIQRRSDLLKCAVICGSNGKSAAFKAGAAISKMICKDSNRNQPNKFLQKLSLGSYNKKIANPKTSNDWLSYNEENVKKYNEDKLCGGIATTGFFKEFLKGLGGLFNKQLLRNIEKDMPIMLIAGEEDPVGNYCKGVLKLAKMYQKLGIIDVKTVLYKDGRHEILNEDFKDKVIDDVVNFIR